MMAVQHIRSYAADAGSDRGIATTTAIITASCNTEKIQRCTVHVEACIVKAEVTPELQHPPVLLTTPVLQQICEALADEAVAPAATAVVLLMPQFCPVKPGLHWQEEVVVLQTPLPRQSEVLLHEKVLHSLLDRGV